MKKIPKRSFRVAGKYLQMLEDYFGDSEIYNPYDGLDNHVGYLNLIRDIAPMFSSCMTQDDVDYVVYGSVAKVEAKYPWASYDGNSDFNKKVAKEVLDTIVMSLQSYPRDYEFRMSLPGFRRLPKGRYQLHENVWLELNPEEDQRADIIVTARGFWREGVDNDIVANFLRKAKIFSYVMHKGPLARPQIKFRSSIAEIKDLITFQVSPFLLPDGMAQLAGAISFKWSTLSTLANKPVVSVDDFVDVMEVEAREFRKNFATLDLPVNSRIATAIEWYEDARAVSNQTMALLEVCIGLEALLGEDGNMADMTNRLCDRFAFTLGRTPAERLELFSQYKNLLALRGKLVHAKIARLDAQGAVILGGSYGMLQRLISHELKLAIG